MIGPSFWTLVGRQSERQAVPPRDRYGVVHETRGKDGRKVRRTMKANLDMAIRDIEAATAISRAGTIKCFGSIPLPSPLSEKL